MLSLEKVDADLSKLISEEKHRQNDTIELIASENFTSKAVMEAVGSILTNKYAEGKPHKRYYNGCEIIDEIEELAQKRCCELFGCDHANVQPHSGSQANQAVFQYALNSGDTILSMDLSNGGHLSHGSGVNFSGLNYSIISYGVDENGVINYKEVEEKAKLYFPKLIICGASNYSKIIDFKKFKEIADGVGALLLADIAHIAGLVATGLHPSPIPYADFVTTTTHKTLRGTRGGVIMCKEEHAQGIDKAVFPGCQGGPLEHVIAGKAVTFKEAMQPEFKKYTQQILRNAKVLCGTLLDHEIDIIGGMTENHLMTIDLRKFGLTGKDVTNQLEKAGITANKNTVPNDPQSPFVTSGIRIGVPAVTTRGMKEADMEQIGVCISQIIKEMANKSDTLYNTTEVVKVAMKKYPCIRYAFP